MEKIPNSHFECKELLVNNGISPTFPSTGEWPPDFWTFNLVCATVCLTLAILPPEIQPTWASRHGRGVHHPWLWGLNAPPLGLADLWRCVQVLGSKKKTKKKSSNMLGSFVTFSEAEMLLFEKSGPCIFWLFTSLNFVGTTFSKGWLDVLRSQRGPPYGKSLFFSPFSMDICGFFHPQEFQVSLIPIFEKTIPASQTPRLSI